MSGAYPTALDRLWRGFRQLVRAELSELPYLATYEYQVAKVTGTTVQASPTSSDIRTPGMIQLPLRVGLPGATVAPSVGSLLYVIFANGDSTKPRVIGYDSTPATSVAVSSTSIALTSASVGISAGFGALEHATSIEGVCNLLVQLAAAINSTTPSTPFAVTDAVLAQAVAAAASSSPTPLTLAAILAALVGKTSPVTGVGWPNVRGG